MKQTPVHREIDPLLSSSQEKLQRDRKAWRNSLLVKKAQSASARLVYTNNEEINDGITHFDVELGAESFSLKTNSRMDDGDALLDQSLSNSMNQKTDNPYEDILSQIPAIIVATILGIIIGIPFGAAYFPLNFFPLTGETAFGLRLFIFSTVICQLVLTFTSNFTNPIGLQIVENVPFYHAIAEICIEELGYGVEALSNLLLILAFATILVGISFYLLGALGLGRAIYFIPKHVLVGLIGGIGFFIFQISIEVVINQDFSFSIAGMKALMQNFHLYSYVLVFELTLRLLTYLTKNKKTGTPKYPLLAPIFYCLIPPLIFSWLWLFGISFEEAQAEGYFFPPTGGSSNDGSQELTFTASIYQMFTDPHLLDPWRVLRLDRLSFKVLMRSIPTIIGMVLFSLIHVPIYVPALNLSTNQDADINNELRAHGWSNLICGFLGGLQNYMGYSNSVAYARAGGKGKFSSIAIALSTALFFFIGPTVCMYIPRCMAGVILLHLGVDLIQESLIDAFHDFERLEYFGICFVAIVISIYGIEEGLLAGVITALSVFIAQSVHVQNPINGHSSAEMLRSSKWNRSAEAKAILDDTSIGCSRILLIQLQGHLFFGNLSKLTESICTIIREHESKHGKVWILILDFSLVLGIDGSVAMGMSKIKDMIHGDYDVSLCVYVTGEKRNKSFPCAYKLADDLVGQDSNLYDETMGRTLDDNKSYHSLDQSTLHRMDEAIDILLHERMFLTADQICHSLNEALKFAEDTLIARSNRNLCDDLISQIKLPIRKINDPVTIQKEVSILEKMLNNLLLEEYYSYALPLISNLEREVYKENDVIWEAGSTSDSAKFVVRGVLVGIQDEERGISEEIESGQIIGEAALVQNSNRTSAVKCLSEVAVLYSLSRKSYQRLLQQSPKIAMCIQIIAIRNLSFRARHVSHNIFFREGRNLSI
mmetsp:Transcript_1591/g.2279  ORF Transcript_1591/g.2279 Transcript_1591/m.2279 type:complete len:936 (+) Transcript_1591:167-2974(+)|eukprot:CAMPEP_0203682312 /NCGR_PEP_ID=MMETSP0090-20130426/45371_1 /ASSEMBLY_ACC=CAM_ASM_001088 /TAXON_ID=426623 /ORGANISM="Chaetoceros affinis, Strain CCMP159" /LENGTH=935 /DNA_ID=CAMNT_0050551185 /DNA_START=59 /DNA_END=2866 /DNA_ORIENTATION=+